MGKDLPNGDHVVPNFVVNVQIPELGIEMLIDSYEDTEDEAIRNAQAKINNIPGAAKTMEAH